MKRLILMMLLICLLCNTACAAIGNTDNLTGNDPTLSTDIPKRDEKLVKEIQGIVFVNGIQLEACSYLRIYSDDTRNIAIPVLAIVKALEAQIRETEAGIFQIQYGSEKFILDTNSKILTEYGKEWNLIGSTPGACNPYYERRESDFYVDNISFLLFLNMIGAEIKYSYSTGKVIISNKTGDGSVSSAND